MKGLLQILIDTRVPFLVNFDPRPKPSNLNLKPYRVGYGYHVNIDPFSEIGTGFCFISRGKQIYEMH